MVWYGAFSLKKHDGQTDGQTDRRTVADTNKGVVEVQAIRLRTNIWYIRNRWISGYVPLSKQKNNKNLLGFILITIVEWQNENTPVLLLYKMYDIDCLIATSTMHMNILYTPIASNIILLLVANNNNLLVSSLTIHTVSPVSHLFWLVPIGWFRFNKISQGKKQNKCDTGDTVWMVTGSTLFFNPTTIFRHQLWSATYSWLFRSCIFLSVVL